MNTPSTRPAIIARYEIVFLLSFAVGLAGTVVSWPARLAAQRATPLADATWLIPATVGVSAASTLLLWWFTARRPSRIARIVVIVFAAIFAVTTLANLLALTAGRAASPAAAVLSVASSILFVLAAAMLFPPDALSWFGIETSEEDE